jgi:hypothetical protein
MKEEHEIYDTRLADGDDMSPGLVMSFDDMEQALWAAKAYEEAEGAPGSTVVVTRPAAVGGKANGTE